MSAEQLELPLKIDKPNGGLIIHMSATAPYSFSIYAVKNDKAQLVTAVTYTAGTTWRDVVHYLWMALGDNEAVFQNVIKQLQEIYAKEKPIYKPK